MYKATFTPPKDLKPAIEQLGRLGRLYLKQQTEGRKVTHKDIAKAADYERAVNGQS